MNGDIGLILIVGAFTALFVLSREETAYIGAGPITPAKKGITPARKGITAAPKPKLVSRFNPKTTYRPIRGQQTKQGSQVKQQHKRTVAKWKKVSDIPPATLRKIQNTWITRARKIALARLAAIINAKKRTGYQTVGYTGGFGGTIAPSVPGVTGAMGANAYSAWEEAMGLKPARNESQLSAAQKRMSNTANGAIDDYINCKGNTACTKRATIKFDEIIRSNTTSVINSMRLNLKEADPTQSMV